MNSQQVPEVRQLPIIEQMRRLKIWVNNHSELFEKYRGGTKLYSFSQFQFITPKTDMSPTANLKWFDKMTGDIRVLLNAQAVLYRNDCPVAAQVLRSALLSTDSQNNPVRLPFEDELPSKKESIVLLMFESAKMIPVMRWLGDNHCQLSGLWEESDNNIPRDDTLSVVNMLPSLKGFWESRFEAEHAVGQEVFQAIDKDILGQFGGVQDWFDAQSYGSQVTAMYLEDDVSRRKSFDGVALAYLLRGVNQAEVLSHIPRALQKLVSTWQFEVYDTTWFGVSHHQIMLIPEEELPHWQGIHQSSLSKGASAGHVAVYQPESVFGYLPNGQSRDMDSTLFLDGI